MPVKKYYFIVDLTPVREASRQGEAINNGAPAEVTPVIVRTRVRNGSADNYAPCCFYLLFIVIGQSAVPDLENQLSLNIDQIAWQCLRSLLCCIFLFCAGSRNLIMYKWTRIRVWAIIAAY